MTNVRPVAVGTRKLAGVNQLRRVLAPEHASSLPICVRLNYKKNTTSTIQVNRYSFQHLSDKNPIWIIKSRPKSTDLGQCFVVKVESILSNLFAIPDWMHINSMSSGDFKG